MSASILKTTSLNLTHLLTHLELINVFVNRSESIASKALVKAVIKH